jgi:hypothetical protein
MAMAAPGIRILAPIPGKSAIGVEIPNRHRELVRLSTSSARPASPTPRRTLPIALGKNIQGEVHIEDLTRMPHLLIAGATGAGKSVGLNAMIVGSSSPAPDGPQVRDDRPEEDRARAVPAAAGPLHRDAGGLGGAR